MERTTKPELFGQDLNANRALLQARMGHLAFVTWREMLLQSTAGIPRPALLVFVNEMVNPTRVEEMVLKPLFAHGVELLTSAAAQISLPVGGVRGDRDVVRVVQGILQGQLAILVDGSDEALLLDVAEVPVRAIAEPSNESSVHGGRESFTSLLPRNIAMLRRWLSTPDLLFNMMELGSLTKTCVAITYIRGKVSPGLVELMQQKLRSVKPEIILDAEELITALGDHRWSILPTALVTERPDTAVRYLAAGRTVIMVNNSPRALVMPAFLSDYLTAADDFYESRIFTLLVRVARIIALFVAIFLPSLYVSVTTFHLQALPTLITLSLLAQREGAPLPTTVEAFLMVITFEILREAGLRLPRPVGPSVSIVGGLVIGEAAMRAGVTSPAMVLVVSATAIATFALPSPALSNVATLLRLGVLGASSFFGFFGVLVSYVLLLALSSWVTSAQMPYASPFMPLRIDYIPDAFGITPRPPYGPGATPDPDLSKRPGWRDQA